MFHSNYIRSGFACLGMTLALGFGAVVRAQEPSVSRQSFEVTFKKEPLDRVPAYYRAFIKAGTFQMAFLVPDGFIGNHDSEHSELLLNRADGAAISFSIREPIAATEEGLDTEACRKAILARFPNARFTLEFSRGIGAGAPRGFDFTWKTTSGIVQACRVIFMPSPIGTIEFKANSTPEKFQAIESSLNMILATMAASVDGNLKITYLSDKI